MKWINSWASGIIVAIIVATILEMLLPEGNNKKYIKIIIGIYVLFTIIAPVVSKFTKESIDFDAIFASTAEYEYNKTVESTSTDKIILDTYVTKLKEEIKQEVSDKGYETIKLEVTVGETEKDYGQIQKINIGISKIENKNKIKDIEQIKINVYKSDKIKEEVSNKETEEVKKYLAETYGIKEENIIIRLEV